MEWASMTWPSSSWSSRTGAVEHADLSSGDARRVLPVGMPWPAASTATSPTGSARKAVKTPWRSSLPRCTPPRRRAAALGLQALGPGLVADHALKVATIRG